MKNEKPIATECCSGCYDRTIADDGIETLVIGNWLDVKTLGGGDIPKSKKKRVT